MGSPLDDAPQLGEWANLIQGQFDPVKIATMFPTIEQASVEFVAYVADLIQKRKGHPKDDLITKLIEAEEDGDRLTEEEMGHLVSAVLVGGVDTTQAQLAHGIRLFAGHPEQWSLLAEKPEEMAKAAADEVLRYEPITPFTARITLEDIEYRDIHFPKDTMSCLRADGEPRPGDLWRRRGLRHHPDRGRTKPLTFGAGPHFCLGANLARAELEEAFAFLAPRMKDLSSPASRSTTRRSACTGCTSCRSRSARRSSGMAQRFRALSGCDLGEVSALSRRATGGTAGRGL